MISHRRRVALAGRKQEPKQRQVHEADELVNECIFVVEMQYRRVISRQRLASLPFLGLRTRDEDENDGLSIMPGLLGARI